MSLQAKRRGQRALIEMDDKFDRLCAAADAGHSTSKAAELAGCCFTTALKYLRKMERPPCPCGRAANHRGRCNYRRTLPGTANGVHA